MKHDERNHAAPVPPAGPMFTPRLLLGYTGEAMLATGLPPVLGGIIAATTRIGLDGFIDSIGIGLIAALFVLIVIAFSLRGQRRPTILIPIGYILLNIYIISVVLSVILKLVPHLVLDSEMNILANFGTIILLCLSPFVFFVWRMIRDPALH